MDSKNVPTALIEIVAPSGSLGAWVVSGWAGDDLMVEALSESFSRQMGEQMAASIISRLTEPQTVEAGGKQFAFVLRPARVYEPYSLTLLKATHSVYRGTDIPKDFRSRVRLANPQTGENREVEIFMNSPLRYGGVTFYQYQMAAGEVARRAGQAPSSTLQVVRNPLLQLREKQSANLEPWKGWNEKPKIIPAVEWLANVMMKPEAADEWPVFRVDNPEVIALLKLPEKDKQTHQDGKHYSWNQIQPSLDTLDRESKRIGEREQRKETDPSHRTPYERAVMKLQEP